MKYAYEDLSPEQFEKLVVLLCQCLLGISVQAFAEGPDGGRDAKFVGTAERHPSKAAPWAGTTIVQAKHTNGHNRSFSESDFYSDTSENTVVGKEIPRIGKLRADKELDHYMLFANRRLTGGTENEIRACISKECGIPQTSIYLCGLEQLDMLLRNFPEVPKLADVDPVDSPLIVSPDDLAEIIEAFDRQRESITDVLEHPPAPRVPYEKKNEYNKMSVEYAKTQRGKYLKETRTIHAFLAAAENSDLLDKYHSVVDEFQLGIIARRKEYQTFDRVMEYLLDLLFARDPVLRQRGHKRLTRAVLFYMYWICDIGKVDDAEAE